MLVEYRRGEGLGNGLEEDEPLHALGAMSFIGTFFIHLCVLNLLTQHVQPPTTSFLLYLPNSG
jgi:hypothetical protein